MPKFKRMGVGSFISLVFLFLIFWFFEFDVVYSYTRPPARKTIFTPHSEDDSSPQQVHISQVRRDHMMITWITENSDPNMHKNKGRRGKNEVGDEKRELVFKEDDQEYVQVLRMLGNGICEAMCIDGTKRIYHIRGKMHKKVWITTSDIILVGLRDYQDDKADVILKNMPGEARLLKAYGELPDNTRRNEGIDGGLDEEDDVESCRNGVWDVDFVPSPFYT